MTEEDPTNGGAIGKLIFWTIWGLILIVGIGDFLDGSHFVATVVTADQTVVTTPDKITIGEMNAATKAKSYLESLSFSRDELIHQLEFDKFTPAEAEYGVSQSGADWNEQAATKAKSYLESLSFSRDGLIHQLEFDKFTPQQAEYGVKSAGY
jgi:hypothetical protein